MSDCLLDPEHDERESLCGSTRHRPLFRPTLGPPRRDPFLGQRVGRYRSVRAYTFTGSSGAVRSRMVRKRQKWGKLSLPPIRWLPGFSRGQSRYDQSQTRLPHAKSNLDRSIDLPWSKSQKITTGNLCLQQSESTRRTRTRTRIYSAPYSYSYLQRTVLTVLVLVIRAVRYDRSPCQIPATLRYGTEASANNPEILPG